MRGGYRRRGWDKQRDDVKLWIELFDFFFFSFQYFMLFRISTKARYERIVREDIALEDLRYLKFWVEGKKWKLQIHNPPPRKAQKNVYNSFVNQNFVFSEKKNNFRFTIKIFLSPTHASKCGWCDAFGVEISRKFNSRINLWKGSLKSWFILQKVTLNKQQTNKIDKFPRKE